MTDDDRPPNSQDDQDEDAPSTAHGSQKSVFHLPRPLKRMFDQFPLVTYAANELPRRKAEQRRRGSESVLFIFTTDEDSSKGRASFNPGCLRWQTYLTFAGLQFRTVPSSNHASPTGVLPFLQPAGGEGREPVAGNRLKKWLAAQKGVAQVEESGDAKYEAYASLVENRVRKAWLFQLYLSPANAGVAHRLYVAPCSSNPLVQFAATRQLRSAAEHELVKSAGTREMSATDLLGEAGKAFEALSTLLGQDEWFFGQQTPGLFDASVFAYTHLLLDEGMQWEWNPIGEALRQRENLVRHRERIRSEQFGA